MKAGVLISTACLPREGVSPFHEVKYGTWDCLLAQIKKDALWEAAW